MDDSVRGFKLPVFNGDAENWPIFLFKFKKAVKSIGLSHLLTENGVKASKATDTVKHEKDDAKVQSMLLNLLSDGAVHLIEDCEDAFDMVRRLQAQYESSSASSILFRFNKALDLTYKEGTKMADHLGELNSLVNQIRAAGDITIDKLHVILMLRSIPQSEQWRAVVTNLKAQDEEDLTKEKVARVLTERALELGEKGTSCVKTGDTEQGVGTFAVEQSRGIICYRCGRRGHIRRNCRENPDRNGPVNISVIY